MPLCSSHRENPPQEEWVQNSGGSCVQRQAGNLYKQRENQSCKSGPVASKGCSNSQVVHGARIAPAHQVYAAYCNGKQATLLPTLATTTATQESQPHPIRTDKTGEAESGLIYYAPAARTENELTRRKNRCPSARGACGIVQLLTLVGLLAEGAALSEPRLPSRWLAQHLHATTTLDDRLCVAEHRRAVGARSQRRMAGRSPRGDTGRPKRTRGKG